MKKSLSSVFFCALLGVSSTLFAGADFKNNLASGDYETWGSGGTNWAGGNSNYDGTQTNYEIRAGFSEPGTAWNSEMVLGFTKNDAYTVGKLTLGWHQFCGGTLTLQPVTGTGTYTVSGEVWLAGNGNSTRGGISPNTETSGTINVGTGATLNVNNNFFLGQSCPYANGSGYLNLNGGTVNAKNGLITGIAVSGTYRTTGSINVSSGTLNLLNAAASGGLTVSQFANAGTSEVLMTGGTINVYGNLYSAESSTGTGRSTVTLKGGNFNVLGYDASRGNSMIGGGRYCVCSWGDSSLNVSGSAALTADSEFIISWGAANGAVNQSGGTVKVLGGNRRNVDGSGSGLNQNGILFGGGNNSGTGSSTYNLSGGTLETSRMTQSQSALSSIFNVSQASASVPTTATVGSLKVTTNMTGGTLNAFQVVMDGTQLFAKDSGGTLATDFRQTGGTVNLVAGNAMDGTAYSNGLFELSNGGVADISGTAVFNAKASLLRRPADTGLSLAVGKTGEGTISFSGNAVANLSGISLATNNNSKGTLNISGDAVVNLLNTQTKEPNSTPSMSFFGNRGASRVNITGGVLNNFGEIMTSEFDAVTSEAVTSYVTIDGGTFNHMGYDKSRGTEKIGGGRMNLCSRGTTVWDLKSGELNVGNAQFCLTWGNGAATSATINQSGGTANIQGGNRFTIPGGTNTGSTGLQFSGQGANGGRATYNLSGGTLTTPKMWRDTTTVSCLFNMTGGTANVGTMEIFTQMSGGTLNAETINLKDTYVLDGAAQGTTFVQSGGTLSPGGNGLIGSTTFQTPYEAKNSVSIYLDYDLNDESKRDTLTFASSADFSGANLELILNIPEYQVGTKEIDIFDSVTLASIQPANAITVNLANQDFGEFRFLFDSSQLFTTGVLTMATGLPEPAAWLLLVLGVPGAVLSLRRRG